MLALRLDTLVHLSNMSVYVILTILTLIYAVYYYLTKTFNYWKDRNVVGPTPVPLFGNIKLSVFRKINLGEIFKNTYDNYPNEKVVGIFRMTTPCLLIRDLDIIKNIMIKDFDCFSDRGVSFSEDGLGANLFHAESELWRVLRNRFTPIFTSGKLKNMLYLMDERGDKFIDYVTTISKTQKEHEIYSLVQKYTMATISACAFGLDIDTLADKMEALSRIDKLIFTPSYAIELDMMYPGILKKLNSSLFPAEIKEFFDQLVKTVISARNGKPTNRKDFMDLLLELRLKGEVQGTMRYDSDVKRSVELTDSLIAAQAFVFYAAGYETSATTMSFMLYELAKNPHIQDKVIAEIDEVLKNHDGKVTYETLSDLKYMEKVFDETLRLYPLVEPLQRNAQVDYKIPNMDLTIKKGTTVLITPMGIQRDPKYYPNPEVFDPERFSPQNEGDRHPCAYMPFGVGPRNCIGMRFAKIQSRMCITKLLSQFRVEASSKTPKVMEFSPQRLIIGPKGGIYLNVVPRTL